MVLVEVDTCRIALEISLYSVWKICPARSFWNSQASLRPLIRAQLNLEASSQVREIEDADLPIVADVGCR